MTRRSLASRGASLTDYATPRVAVSENDSLRTAAQRMQTKSVGSVIVLDGSERPIGLVTDRDLALRALRSELDPDTTPVEQVMSAPLVTAGPDTTVDEALLLMQRRGVRRLPLVAGNRAVGLVALDDLLVDLASQWTALCAASWRAGERERGPGGEHEAHEALHQLESLHHRLQFASYFVPRSLVEGVERLKRQATDLLYG